MYDARMGEVPPQPTGDEPLVEVPDSKLGRAFKPVEPTHCELGHPYRRGVSTSHWFGCRCKKATRGGGHWRIYCDVPTADGPCPNRRIWPECLDPSRQGEANRRG